METPSILIYGREKNEPEHYTGKKLAYNIQSHVKSHCNSYGYKIQSTFAPSSASPKNDNDFKHRNNYLSFGYNTNEAEEEHYHHSKTDDHRPKIGEYGLWENSLRLEVDTFEKTVLNDSEHAWVIAFMDPHCSGCNRLVPEWEKLKDYDSIHKLDVKFGYVDIT